MRAQASSYQMGDRRGAGEDRDNKVKRGTKECYADNE